jgi:hypothetical protein
MADVAEPDDAGSGVAIAAHNVAADARARVMAAKFLMRKYSTRLRHGYGAAGAQR